MEKKLFDKDAFKAVYKNLTLDKGLMTTLGQMQMRYGITERKAYENAEAMIQMFAGREAVKGMLTEDARATLENFLQESKEVAGYDRKAMLHKLSFGLKLYQDGDLSDQLKEGVSREQLFREYLAVCGEDPAITEDVLEQQILELMDGYAISPKAMEYIAKELGKSGNMLATGAALGEEGQRFKCIVAMDLYLRNRDTMTMEEAMNQACTGIEIQAVADAVATGEITREKAKKVLEVIVMVLLVAGLASLLLKPQLTLLIAEGSGILTAKAYADAATVVETVYFHLMGIGLGLDWLTDPVAEWLGGVAARHRFLRLNKESKAAETMQDMAVAAEVEEDTQDDGDVIRGRTQKNFDDDLQPLSPYV